MIRRTFFRTLAGGLAAVCGLKAKAAPAMISGPVVEFAPTPTKCGIWIPGDDTGPRAPLRPVHLRLKKQTVKVYDPFGLFGF